MGIKIESISDNELLWIQRMNGKWRWNLAMSYSSEEMRTRDAILDKFYTLDYLCCKQGVVAEIVVLGGAALLLLMEQMGEQFRPTRDIDVHLISTNNMQALLRELEKINVDVVGGIMEVPPSEDLRNKESLFELDLDFSAIRVYVPTIELLACCKIFSTREKDLIDLKETQILEKCDTEKLLGMVAEYREYLLNPSNQDLNLYELDNILKEKGIL
ncbi:hypothetical protein ETC03_04085 [Geobacillus sp. MMMUD3]|nr:hypothetical protein [Geobacillus sp. MMMUD3]